FNLSSSRKGAESSPSQDAVSFQRTYPVKELPQSSNIALSTLAIAHDARQCEPPIMARICLWKKTVEQHAFYARHQPDMPTWAESHRSAREKTLCDEEAMT
ncbi:unnamed protein product, partial [Mycena citricolor]